MAKLPSLYKGAGRSFRIFRIKGLTYIFLPHPLPSEVYPLTRSHQLAILYNDRVNNLPTDQTFPSPELFLGTVKFVIDHGTPAAKTSLKRQFTH